MNKINPVRPSPIAGSWYTANPTELSQEIHGYLNAAHLPKLEGELLGLISPHAGYFYSGATAGHAYRAVEGMKFDLCVVVSPLHNYLPYPLLTTAHDYFSTPLGEVEVARDLLEKLTEKVSIQAVANDREHSLEIQLPFLQIALASPFKLLPLMVRSMEGDYLQQTAAFLADLIRGQNALLVASTDLSHFYDEKTATAFDQKMIKRMSDFSPAGVLAAEENHEGFACGAGAVAMVLWTAKALGANKVTPLRHATSAEASGDRSSVVGYGALAISRQEDV